MHTPGVLEPAESGEAQGRESGENWVETADEAKLAVLAQVFTHISTHNAYHIGQIIYVRKEQGSWDSKYGVQ